MPEPLRVAIAGAGIGAAHFHAYRALPDRFAVHMICDLNPARAAPLIEASPATRFEDDLGAVPIAPAGVSDHI